MKTNLQDDYNLLFKFAVKGLKYFVLALVGFAIAYVISTVLNVVPIAQILLSSILWQWMMRIAVFIFCLFAIAIILDSWR
ncbi:hypothetical protein [Fischerella thermalis]|jgi:cation transporter-like permease|uniref:Uncharacterized protein n=1 Tax=Fischerella thermalis JSC-11 TaxID=741277 RepID=G6FXC0_9CYAN|nr:hypothetical protein [Fischerella thermalis]PLZ83716.1 hypothetical protein CBP16_03050 [Fischerella thermalis WC217]PMB02546.1 hypothetical protein CI592_16180 [Fischerella thermalis CCMEE 5328]PMB05235.1 hypothetical protein CEN49_18695 [Fischerella thermalis CCMEE 5273]EHC10580.1 hypothetical protein FJSC11DRAFT_3519 [Fischerella thermalis JSC-11]PLZ04556.1 hypothetical protein CBP18_22090 [Fischerella thermalis WC119]